MVSKKETSSSKSTATAKAESPLMRQYAEIKQKHPDAILLFRVGDFYETFGQDAVFTSKVLDIVLTRKAGGGGTFVELAGIPYHALDSYLHKLVKAGKKVAICEQLEDPKLTKKLVKRGVTELITPGISLNDKLLERGKNNFLCGICPLAYAGKVNASSASKAQSMGAAFLDISTGEFYVAEGSAEYIRKLMDDFAPAEVVMPKAYRDGFCAEFGNRYYITVFEDWVFKPAFARETLLNHFGTHSLKGFGVEDLSLAQAAAASCLYYLSESKHEKISHIASIQKVEESEYVWMDAFTLRNLEVLDSSRGFSEGVGNRRDSLYAVVNKTCTPMGARLLRRFLTMPLKEIGAINRRLDDVEFLSNHSEDSDFLSDTFSSLGDLERLLSKVAAYRVQPRELLQLKNALETVAQVASHPFAAPSAFATRAAALDACPELAQYIGTWIHPEAPAVFNKGNVIAPGADANLDELRKIAFSGKEYLADLLKKETEQSGIANLKLGFNNVYGYYMEVTRANRDKVPSEWIRKQTLTTGERYTTQELRTYEEKVLDAQQKIEELENTLYQEVLRECCTYIKRIQNTVQSLAYMDVINSFSRVSSEYNYHRPVLEDSYDFEIVQGRHPVIERNMESGKEYVPNDIRFSKDGCHIMMITGPNMSGKSAVLRQTALIVLLAQAGCFVPAVSARIGLVDKIFTRVGASDNIASGESTFMVEMNETANIINNLTERSLVLLDEIGRGTSTYDGISIARAIAEYLHEAPGKGCKVLFATHYHELNQMAAHYPHIRNFHVKVKEVDDRVIFLRTLEEGGSEHSFGIHVAEMAGMPKYVVNRAREILEMLEEIRENGANVAGQGAASEAVSKSPAVKKASQEGIEGVETTEREIHKPYQLSFIQLDDPLLEKIRDEILDLDLDKLTPIQALNKLDEIKKLLRRKK